MAALISDSAFYELNFVLACISTLVNLVSLLFSVYYRSINMSCI